MASLIPLSNSPLIKNTKSNLAIVPNQNKLPYNSIKPKNANKVEPTNALVPFVGEDKKQPESKENCCEKSYTKVVKIDKLLNKNLSLRKKQAKISRLNLEKSEFEKREKELEKKKPKQDNKLKLPSIPKLGIFDWIKNYITQTFLGFIFVRLIDFLPKLLKIVPVIISAGEFFINWGGKLLDGFITFVDWGNKIYKSTRTFLGNIGGDGVLKLFDTFTDNLNLVFDLAVVAALSSLSGDLDTGRSSPGKRGYDLKGNRVGKNAQQRYARRYGVDQFKTRFGSKNLTNLPRSGGRGFISRVARNAFVGAAGKSGAKQILKFVKPLVNKIPIIGGLIEFGLSWALGEPIGKAAFKGIGAVLVGAIGTAIGGPIGAFLGSWAGSEAGGVLYDMFFGNKPPKKQKKQKPVRAAGGGQPKISGKTSRPRRTIKKKKPSRTISIMPRKIRPGASIGGEEKVQKVFPDTKKKQTQRPWWDPFGWFGGTARVRQSQSQDESQVKKKSPTTIGKTPNPQEFLLKTYNDIWSKSTDIFGTISTVIFKSILGQTPDKIDYLNVGKGLNSWMRRIFDPAFLAFSGGGEVDARQFFQGEDYTKVIAKSVEESVSRDVNATIRNLSRELTSNLLLPKEDIEKSDMGTSGDIPSDLGESDQSSSNSGDYKQLLDLIAGVESTSYGGYNAFNRGGSAGGTVAHGSGNATRDSIGGVLKPLTQRTVKEIMSLQRKGELHATGRYQIIASTLSGLMRGSYGNTGVNLNDLYNAETQDKLGIALIKYRLRTGANPSNFRNEWIGLRYVPDAKLQSAINKAQRGRVYSNENVSTLNVPSTSRASSLSRGLVTSYFGSKESFRRKAHEGVDIGLSQGTPLSFKLGGTVLNSFRTSSRDREAGGGYGGYMDVRLSNGIILRLAHLSKIFPKKEFKPGDVIALSGGQPGAPGSGRSSGAHLHLEQHSGRMGIGETLRGKLDPIRHGGFNLVQTGGIIRRFHGGPILNTGYFFGHKGEYVIDKDSVDLLGTDFMNSLNSVENKSQLIARVPGIIEKLKSISGYMDYDVQQEVVIMRVPTEPEVVPIPIGRGGGSVVISKTVNNNTFENLEVIG